MSKLNITVQDITHEIIDAMSLYEFPQIPFIVKGNLEGLIIRFESLESDVFFFYDLIELWYVDRKHERWSLDNIVFSQRLLYNLKHIKLRNFPFIKNFGIINLSHAYYKELLLSYIGKLHLIKCSLEDWLKFLFIVEDKRYDRVKIHNSLKKIFK